MKAWHNAFIVFRLALIAFASLMGCSRGTTPPAPQETAIPSGASKPAPPMPKEQMSGRAAPKPFPPQFSAEQDPPEAQGERGDLVRRIVRGGQPWEGSGPWDEKVLDAMRAVPRHLFMPGAPFHLAYSDRPNPIGYGQTISQPTVVALMTDALDLKGKERVLEIGTGSGYQAAVLAMLCKEVFSIEIVEELGKSAERRLDELGYSNVRVRVGDGYKGWPEHAPFDRILLTAAPPEVPKDLIDQLKDGGLLVAPVGEEHEVQALVRWTKRGSEFHKENLGAVRFVPMVPGPQK